MNQQMRDLFELASFGDVQNIVPTIVQVIARPSYGAESGISGSHTGKGDGLLGLEAGGSGAGPWKWDATEWREKPWKEGSYNQCRELVVSTHPLETMGHNGPEGWPAIVAILGDTTLTRIHAVPSE